MKHLPVDSPRAMGQETEYGLHPQPIMDMDQSVVRDNLPADINIATSHNFAANGSRIYVDQLKNIEYATPECITARGLLASHFAGEDIVREVVDKAFAGKRTAQKRTIDMALRTRGDHENYLTGSTDTAERIGKLLLTHLATRSIYTGPGMILPVGEGYMYVLDQKIWDMDPVNLISGTSTVYSEKAFILTRDEPFDSTGETKRLNIISGSANMFPFPIMARFLSTSLVLRLIENNQFPHDLMLDDEFISAIDTATDLDMKKELELRFSKSKYTAAQIQHSLALAAITFVEAHTDVPREEKEFAYLWATITSDLMSGDIDRWSDCLEWVKKRHWLENKMKKESVGLGNPRIIERDIKWHSLDKDNPVFKLRQLGRVAFMPTDKAKTSARTEAPDPTRARLRGAAVEKFGSDLTSADWNWWTSRDGHTTRVDDVLTGTIAA